MINALIETDRIESSSGPVLPETPLEGLAELFLKANRNALPVVDAEGRLRGIVSHTDVWHDGNSGGDVEGRCVRDIMTENPVTAFPDDTLNTVLQRMAPRDLSRLPVVSRSDPNALLGVIRRNDVVRAYDLGLARRGRDTQEILAGVRRAGDVDFVEVDLTRTSRCVDRSVAEISPELPEESLLVSIRRADGRVVFPHGSTVFREGDRIVAYTDKSRLEDLRRCLGAS